MSRTKAEELDLDAPLFADEDSPLLLEEEEGVEEEAAPREPYRILVVDDDPEVIAVTRIALGDLKVDGTPVEIVSATSSAEARAAVQRGLSFGLAILDVVMERPEAGLELARFLRNLPACACSRVVLRTGQPGIAPEEEVLRAYDINDY
ncbi:MAG TPA: histidine kinase, partial [Myxococcota bacterium]|nr:histidine kinase [Myxococcota bacterium]